MSLSECLRLSLLLGFLSIFLFRRVKLNEAISEIYETVKRKRFGLEKKKKKTEKETVNEKVYQR